MKQTVGEHKKPAPKAEPRIVRDLILLFSVPIAVLLLAAAVIYGPRFFANPQYDFIYVTCGGYSRDCTQRYVISSNGRLDEVVSDLPDYGYDDHGTLYYYDMSEASSKRISLAEAQEYDLGRKDESPDGYRLARHTQRQGGLFWSNSSSGWQLENGLLKKQIDLAGDEYGDKQLLGWIE